MCYETYLIIQADMRKETPWYLNQHVLASGWGLHCEGGGQSGTNVLCYLVKESDNYYMGQWEWSIYFNLIFKKTEFQITKETFTRSELLEFLKINGDHYRWRRDRILEKYAH